MTDRPNILLIMADQHAEHLLSCAGATHLRTPALDALAADGVRFTRAYTTFPLCVPARASMITGKYPHELGLFGNNAIAEEPGRGPESLGYLLRSLGYDTAYAGKWHALQASAAAEDGFEVIAPFGDRGLAEASAAWLAARADADRPFALVVSFDDPHSICEYARRQPMPYGEVEPPPSVRDLPPLPANHAPVPYEPEALRHEQRQAAHVYGTSGYGPDDWRRYRHAYARLIERTDSHVGIVLDALAAAGLADDTVVLYTSDHGDGDASHAWNQKTALFEESCKVPLIVRDPRRGEGAAETSALVNIGLDLLPTLVSIAGGEKPDALAGLDLTPVAAGGDGHDQIVVETSFDTPPGTRTAARTVITHRYKYVVYGWGAHREQLFDLHADPGERCNLAEESASDPVLEDFRRRLLDWCVETNDTRFLKRLKLPADADQGVHDRIFAIPY